MAPKTTNLAIMFADISGSTQLYENLGDVTARHTVSECLGVMTKVIKRYNGVVIKTIGDEIMCTFPTAEDAATAACEMNEELEDDITGQAPGTDSLSIRVGMHFGPAILEGGDVFGDAVNVAARMASLAKANQIITTQHTVEQLSPVLRASTRFIDRAPVKGKKEAIDIFEVIWQQEDVTRMSTGVIPQNQNTSVLRLAYKGTEVVLNDKQTTVVMGRSVSCYMAVDEKLASRQHVKLECRRGKFFITDQSTNGTYLLPEGGSESFLRREEVPISGRGKLSLGRSFSENPADVVQYVIEES